MKSRSRHHLLVATVGDGSHHRSWISGPADRSFDVLLVDYGGGGRRFASDADILFERQGTKFRLVKWALAQLDIEQYELFFFPDDDLDFTTEDASRLFEICKAQDLMLAQPALDATSMVSFEITRAVPGSFLRYTNFVEVMCPVFIASTTLTPNVS